MLLRGLAADSTGPQALFVALHPVQSRQFGDVALPRPLSARPKFI